jgi:hypothetical protein
MTKQEFYNRTTVHNATAGLTHYNGKPTKRVTFTAPNGQSYTFSFHIKSKADAWTVYQAGAGTAKDIDRLMSNAQPV